MIEMPMIKQIFGRNIIRNNAGANIKGQRLKRRNHLAGNVALLQHYRHPLPRFLNQISGAGLSMVRIDTHSHKST